MKATHNIKVNGKWIHAGEEYGIRTPFRRPEHQNAPARFQKRPEETEPEKPAEEAKPEEPENTEAEPEEPAAEEPAEEKPRVKRNRKKAE